MANLLKSILLFLNETAVLRDITNFLFKQSKHSEGDIKKHPGDILKLFWWETHHVYLSRRFPAPRHALQGDQPVLLSLQLLKKLGQHFCETVFYD